MYVGTEQGVSIIDKTNKVVSPQVPTHKEDFICISFFLYEGEVYFSAIFDGLYKIDESGVAPKIPVMLHKKHVFLRSFGSTLYNANNGFINKFDIIAIQKRNFSSFAILVSL
jgi:hypothetical protein